MEVFQIDATDDSPRVIFDPHKQIMEISGRSYVENTDVFYQPLINWIVDYCSLPKSVVNLHFNFIYFSTATTKSLVKIFVKLEKFSKMSVPIFIHWHYEEEDEDILEAGEEFD
ncbi:MAG: DUF1987 domain-containing protein, partial [Bacteroidales bacterium]|nr:DUF1987 domain-containing protein [Bacteroidales bacterium]